VKRRSFIQLTAITGTGTALAGCGNPEHQIIRFIPDEEHVPGVAQWKPSVCPLCPSGCGVLVRIMEGDAEVVRGGQAGVIRMGLAKKLEGNPAHPISQGSLCARGQAAIQVTYHPDRLRHPLKRTGPRGSGEYQEVTWDAALAELTQQLDALRSSNAGSSLAFLKRPGRSQRDELVTRFLEAFGAPPAASFELFSDDVLRRANLLSFGREQLPTFDLAESRYVISFGADFLGTWNSPVAQNAAYGRMRQGRRGVRGTFVQIEPRMSQTGANADHWIPVKPGMEGVLALGLAQILMAEKLRPLDGAAKAGALIDGWTSGLRDYTPAEIERRTGVPAARLERLAREIAEERPAVAIIGGAALAHTNGLFSAIAVNALNALLGAVDQRGGIVFMPQLPARSTATRGQPRPLKTLASDILAADPSPVKVLLVDEVDPVFAAPPGWKVRDALMRVPFIASFSSFVDDTSALADLILPDHSFLESWVERTPESGAAVAVVSLAGPALKPLHNTRPMPDVLLQVAGQLAKPLDLPWKTFDEMLMVTYSTLPAPSADTDAWTAAQKQGGWWGEPARARGGVEGAERREPPRGRAETGGSRVVDPQFDGDAATYPFHFLPYASQAFLDGSLAHLPWLQELPDAISTAMWSSWIEINPQTAANNGIAEGDVVEVASTQGTLRVPALLSPGIAPDVVAMPVGQGHQYFTRYASGRGANPVRLVAPLTEPETGSLAWAATRVRLSRVSGPSGDLILFAGEKRENPNEGRR